MDEAAIEAAFNACKTDILNNLESLTLKSVRQRLECDLGLESNALKSQKTFVSGLVDKLIASQATAASAEAKIAAQEKEARASSPAAKRARTEKAAPTKKVRKPVDSTQTSPTDQAPQSGKRQLSAATLRLRGMCTKATIGIPPSVYIQNKTEEGLKEALGQLLAKHGLDKSSGSEAVEAVARKLAKERDLDGIDTSNIVTGGRRRQITQVVRTYREASEEEDSSDDDNEASDSAASDVSEEAAPSPRAGADGRSDDEEVGDFKFREADDEAEESTSREDDEDVAGSESPVASRGRDDAKEGSGGEAPQRRRVVLVDSDDE